VRLCVKPLALLALAAAVVIIGCAGNQAEGLDVARDGSAPGLRGPWNTGWEPFAITSCATPAAMSAAKRTMMAINVGRRITRG